MKLFYRVISLLFHPILAPLAGVIAYFLITPKYSPIELQAGNVLPMFILTIVIPILSFFILRNIGLINSMDLPTVIERKYPLYIHLVLLSMIIYKVIPNNYILEVYFYFAGLIIATLVVLVLLFFKIKTSMHLLGMGGVFMYLINLSIHFEINITIGLSAMILLTGIVASSRLYLRAHTKMEVLLGFFIGIISQLLTVKYWL